MELKINIAVPGADLKEIAHCRIKAFPKSLSSKLGEKYVIKMLRNYTEGGNFLLYMQEDGEYIGFTTGLVNNEKHNCSTRVIIDNTAKDLFFGLLKKPWLFMHPIVLNNWKVGFEIFKNKFRSKEVVSKEKQLHPPTLSPEVIDSVGLIDIAVAPRFQGKGFSSILLKAFEEHCISIGETRMHLSVNPANTSAIASYKKNGWIMFKAEPHQLNFYKEIK